MEKFTEEELGVATWPQYCTEVEAFNGCEFAQAQCEHDGSEPHECDGCNTCWDYFIDHAQEIFNAWCDNDSNFDVYIEGGPCNWQGRRGWKTARVDTVEDVLKVIMSDHGDCNLEVHPEVSGGRKFLSIRHGCHDCSGWYTAEIVPAPPEADTPIYRNENKDSDVIGYVWDTYYPEKNGYDASIYYDTKEDKYADDRIIVVPVYSDTGEIIRWVKDWGYE